MPITWTRYIDWICSPKDGIILSLAALILLTKQRNDYAPLSAKQTRTKNWLYWEKFYESDCIGFALWIHCYYTAMGAVGIRWGCGAKEIS